MYGGREVLQRVSLYAIQLEQFDIENEQTAKKDCSLYGSLFFWTKEMGFNTIYTVQRKRKLPVNYLKEKFYVNNKNNIITLHCHL